VLLGRQVLPRLMSAKRSLRKAASTFDHVSSLRALHERGLEHSERLFAEILVAVAVEGRQFDEYRSHSAIMFGAIGNPLRAARIGGAAERWREEIGCPLTPVERLRHDRHMTAARAAAMGR